jgi:signal transduction histidine kinase
MEIDPVMFPSLSTHLLQPDTHNIEIARLREIYQEMLKMMERWFRTFLPDDEDRFELEVINVKRLLDRADPNELLILFEFICVIAMRSDRMDELVRRIIDMSDTAQTDLMLLIKDKVHASEPSDDFDVCSNDTEQQRMVWAYKQIDKLENKIELL